MTEPERTPAEEKRLRRAAAATGLILEAMYHAQVPVDSCLLAAEVARDIGRELGYRTRVQPVRVQANHEDGRAGNHVGYGTEPVAEDRYPGHAVTIWQGTTVLDPTAIQFWPEEIPGMAFQVPRRALDPEPYTLVVPGGWELIYTPFNDGGDWTRGVDADTRAGGRETARRIARMIK